MSTVRLRTHAKVNLFLRVVGLRSDGYHEVETILHGIKLADDIDVTLTSSGRTEIEMLPAGGLTSELFPVTEDNFIAHATERLATRVDLYRGLLIRVIKRIPIAAGLGGGSGNAAGALVALNELWNLKLDPRGLIEVAAEVGSDVAYCIGGGTALATSRGEELTKLPAPVAMWFVLGFTNVPMFTRDVYQKWDELEGARLGSSAPMTLALGAGDIAEVAALLHNDLEAAAFDLRPALQDQKQALLEAGVLGACMSGSGPTMFGIAGHEADARNAADEVAEVFDRVLVVPSQVECIERL